MTSDTLASIVAILISLAFAYIPGVKDWYTPLDSTRKAGIMAVMLVVVALGAFGLSCGQIAFLAITCDKQGAIGLAQILINALIANQGAYLLLVRPGERRIETA